MKKIFLIIPLLIFSIYSCTDSVSPSYTYFWELVEFNRVSNFNAHLTDDTAIVNHAKSGQGHGTYSGIDDWFSVRLDSGAMLWGGLPGQSNYYSIIATYDSAKGEKVAYWKLLQVKPHAVFGYRSYIAGYRLNKTVNASISKTLANKQYGDGGAWQIYIQNYHTDLLKVSEITLKDTSVTFN